MLSKLARTPIRWVAGFAAATLALTGLAAASVSLSVLTAAPASAVTGLTPTAEEQWLAERIVDLVGDGKLEFENRWINSTWTNANIATEDLAMIQAYANGEVMVLDGRACYLDVRLMRALVGLVTPKSQGGFGYEYVYVSSTNRYCRHYERYASSSSRHWVGGGGGAIDITRFRPEGGSTVYVDSVHNVTATIDFAIAFITAAGGRQAQYYEWSVGQENFYTTTRYQALGINHQSDPDPNHVHIQLTNPTGNDRSYPVSSPFTY